MSVAAIPRGHRDLPLALIDEPARPSRTTMDEQKLDELVADMKANGFIGSIVVAQVGERYQVVAGHRRTLAARRAGLVAIPCQVFPDRRAALDAVQHSENKHREALSPADEAIWFREILDDNPTEGTDGVVARVGESRAYVEAALLLLDGDEKIFADLKAGRLTKTVAALLNKVTDPLHRNLLRHNAVHQGATNAVVTSWVREWKRNIEPYVSGTAPADGAVTPGPVSAPNYFTCHVCRGTEDVPRMVSLQIHDYCVKSQLDPALRAFAARGDVVDFPRTREQAVTLIERVFERFPEIGDVHP